jgi:hypothetical protein
MRNKTLIYGIAVVVLLGIAWFAFRNGTFGGQQATVVTSQNGDAPVTLKDLLARGGTQICTFNNSTNGVNTSGTVYIQNGKLRGDFTTQNNGQNIAGHMVVDNNTSFFWTDLTAQGFKVPFNSLANAPTGHVASQSSLDTNLPMQYSCKQWSADSSVFNLPKNVVFTDLSGAGGQ